MARLEYFVIAESVSVDKSTNRLSLFHVLDELVAVEVPADVNLPRGVIPQLVAASTWNLKPEEFGQAFKVALRLKLPGENDFAELSTIQFVAESKKQRTLQVILGLPAKGPGDMEFELLLDGQHQATHTLVISHPAGAPPAGSNNAHGDKAADPPQANSQHQQ